MGRPGRSRHLAARVEDFVDCVLRATLRWRGWTPRVTTSTGYGGPDGIRVFARVLFASPAERAAEPSRRPQSPRGWRSLITVPAVGVDVQVVVGGVDYAFRSDRGGYVHGEIRATLAPGWHEVTVAVAGRAPVVAQVRVINEHTRVVSSATSTTRSLSPGCPDRCAPRGTRSSCVSTPGARFPV